MPASQQAAHLCAGLLAAAGWHWQIGEWGEGLEGLGACTGCACCRCVMLSWQAMRKGLHAHLGLSFDTGGRRGQGWVQSLRPAGHLLVCEWVRLAGGWHVWPDAVGRPCQLHKRRWPGIEAGAECSYAGVAVRWAIRLMQAEVLDGMLEDSRNGGRA